MGGQKCEWFERVREAELESIRKRRKALDSNRKRYKASQSNRKRRKDPGSKREAPERALGENLVGLALSGGGIRSATFSLGVLQRLAKDGFLDRVDYLSTVSGGGYIGGALTWFANSGARLGTGAANFPHGVVDPRPGRRGEETSGILKHLRLHGKYLVPGRGITRTSLLAVILRGVLLNFLVWLPLVTAVLVLLMYASGFVWGLEYVRGLAHKYGVHLGHACGGNGECGLEWLLWLAGLMGSVFFLWSAVYSLGTRMLGVKGSYTLRRFFEKWIRWVLGLGLGFLVVGSLPITSDALIYAPSVLLGLAGGVLSFLRSGTSDKGRVPLGLLAPAASVFLLYGLMLVCYELASRIVEPGAAAGFISLTGLLVLGVSVLVSIGTGWCVNLNYISIHRYYRDRLMEAFMPDPDTDGTTAPAAAADKAQLGKMDCPQAPYHLVNTNVVLVDSDCARWRVRGGDSFVLSQRYCGSTATGWVQTSEYMQRDPLTLATTVAISGASVNPNTGAGGVGPTRKPMLSLLMALLNVRLGYWVPRPCACRRRQPVACHFRAAWYELHPRGYAEHRDMLQLSDGGHFENLGVYELVRRKAKVIICCDGAADPDFEFVDLQVLQRRISADFGASIDFDCENRLEQLIPREPDPGAVLDPNVDAYPVGAKFASRGHIKGTITYNCGTTGTLILLKTTMIKGLSLLVKGYKAANRAFPDQSTGDQFFDEEQFEAYRELGHKIADKMVIDDKVNLQGLLDECLLPDA